MHKDKETIGFGTVLLTVMFLSFGFTCICAISIYAQKQMLGIYDIEERLKILESVRYVKTKEKTTKEEK